MIDFIKLEILQIDTIIKLMLNFYAIDNYPIDIEVSKKLFHEFISNENLGKSWLIYDSDEEGNSEIVGYVILTFSFSFFTKSRTCFKVLSFSIFMITVFIVCKNIKFEWRKIKTARSDF